MKKNKWHIALSVFLLAMMLVGRVGIHVFHHHDSLKSQSAKTSKNSSGVLLLAEHDNEADCALCKIESFQQLALQSTVVFVFFLMIVETRCRFLISEIVRFSFYTQYRGPPVFFYLA